MSKNVSNTYKSQHLGVRYYLKLRGLTTGETIFVSIDKRGYTKKSKNVFKHLLKIVIVSVRLQTIKNRSCVTDIWSGKVIGENTRANHTSPVTPLGGSLMKVTVTSNTTSRFTTSAIMGHLQTILHVSVFLTLAARLVTAQRLITSETCDSPVPVDPPSNTNRPTIQVSSTFYLPGDNIEGNNSLVV